MDPSGAGKQGARSWTCSSACSFIMHSHRESRFAGSRVKTRPECPLDNLVQHVPCPYVHVSTVPQSWEGPSPTRRIGPRQGSCPVQDLRASGYPGPGDRHRHEGETALSFDRDACPCTPGTIACLGAPVPFAGHVRTKSRHARMRHPTGARSREGLKVGNGRTGH